MAEMIHGIDISRWQGADFSMERAKAKADFVLARCMTGEFPGDGKDSQWENNYAKAKNAGLPIGAYVFGYAATVAEAEREAAEAISILKGKQLEYPVFYDVEHKRMLSLSKRLLTDIIKAFCQKMEAAGYWVGIYSSTSMYDNSFYDSELTRYTHWVADWRGAKPTLKSGAEVAIWQTGSEKYWQDNLEVDLDICYVDYFEKVAKEKGLNNWPKPGTNATADIDDEIRLELSAIKTAAANIEKLLERRK